MKKLKEIREKPFSFSVEIVLPIHPKYAQAIVHGKKRYEYRRKIPKRSVKKIYIYETAPTKAVIGDAEIVSILKLPPNRLYEETKEGGGINKEQFDKYFSGCKMGYAFKLGRVNVYSETKRIEDIGVKTVPQSFAYVSSEKTKK